jgi:Holliday junction DNA helicase RuvA
MGGYENPLVRYNGFMICSLKGEIVGMDNNSIEVEVSGVGYCVGVGLNYLKKHQVGDKVKVMTHMAVSENDMALYGFETREELSLFRMLITVSGVGPKTAAQILGQVSGTEVIKAIAEAEVKFFEKIKGIGKKTAQRIIVDLKSKVGGLGELNLKDDDKTEVPEENDIVLSLKQLGFEKKEIDKVMGKIPGDLERVEDKLGWCLRNME